ncbi:hypothetical protein TNCV_2827161 [Trichonephila clavipes]|nr:hypothetical protein TNCV_2827161 [Trichonephila clavipes]
MNTLIRAVTEEWDKLPQQLLDNVVQNSYENSSFCKQGKNCDALISEGVDTSCLIRRETNGSKDVSHSLTPCPLTYSFRSLERGFEEPLRSDDFPLLNESRGRDKIFENGMLSLANMQGQILLENARSHASYETIAKLKELNMEFCGIQLTHHIFCQPSVFKHFAQLLWTKHYGNEDSLKNSTSLILNIRISPAGRHSWFVAGLLFPKLRVRPWPKSVDVPDAENRQRPCRMIKRLVKDLLSVCLTWMLSAKLNSQVQILHR